MKPMERAGPASVNAPRMTASISTTAKRSPVVWRSVPLLGIEIAGSGYYGNGSPTNYQPAQYRWRSIGRCSGGHLRSSEKRHGPMRENNSRAIPGNTIGFTPGSILTGISNNINPTGTPPQRMDGFYIQGNYHFMPEFLAKFSPKRFGEGSTFTAVFVTTASTPTWITRRAPETWNRFPSA